MRKFVLKTEVQSVDKSSKNVDKITKSYERLTKTVTKQSTIAGRSFKSFSQKVSLSSKRVMVSMNNINASINRTFRKMSSSKLALGFGIGLLAVAASIGKSNIDLDASLASLQAITGKAGTEFVEFRTEIDKVSASQKTFAGDTAKAFEIVASAQPVLLNNAAALADVTNAAITLKKAGLIPIEESSKALTGTMNQFGLEADQAQRVINVLAAGAKEGSANISLLAESFDKVGGIAKSANLSVEQTGAAIELMSKFNLKGSEAGISLKSTLLRLKSASLGFASGQFNLNDALNEYNKMIGAIKDPIKRAAKEEEIFGKVHILTGKILTENIGELDRLTVAMTGTNEATIQSEINNNTLKNRLVEIQAAWKNATTASADQGDGLKFIKNIMVKVADNMKKIVSVGIILLKGFIAFKAIMLASTIAIGAYNIAIGIMAALSSSASIAIGSNAVALTAYNIVSKLATAAQWLLNTAFYGFPLVWILAAFAAVVAGIVYLVKNWDELSEKLAKDWARITTTFKEEGLGGVFRMWGKELLIQVIDPLIGVLAIIAKVTKGKHGLNALEDMVAKRDRLLIETGRGDELRTAIPKEMAVENNTTENLITSLDKNSYELEKNTSAAIDGWTGKFSTSILRDANINERSSGIVQRELATTLINNENSIVNNQKDVIDSNSLPISTVNQNNTRSRNEKNINGAITINVVDKTGGNFALEVEGTGINVVTTGNNG